MIALWIAIGVIVVLQLTVICRLAGIRSVVDLQGNAARDILAMLDAKISRHFGCKIGVMDLLSDEPEEESSSASSEGDEQ